MYLVRINDAAHRTYLVWINDAAHRSYLVWINDTAYRTYLVRINDAAYRTYLVWINDAVHHSYLVLIDNAACEHAWSTPVFPCLRAPCAAARAPGSVFTHAFIEHSKDHFMEHSIEHYIGTFHRSFRRTFQAGVTHHSRFWSVISICMFASHVHTCVYAYGREPCLHMCLYAGTRTRP